MFRETIAAIATPAGIGSIGIVRLSGPDAFSIVSRISHLSSLQHARLVHCTLYASSGEPLDEVVLLPFKAPHSYTGEDVVEICCHGGSACPPAVLRACLKFGARLAQPGEFTQRAFLSGKLDLAQAEAVCDLIVATAESQRRLATRQLTGELSRRVRRIADRLRSLIAAVEASVDFSEEVGELDIAFAREALNEVHHEISELRCGYRQGRLVREGAVVAIVGLPNVGKSSLLNALVGSERAIVTEVPGTTRDTIEDRILLDGVPVTLWDTAGLRETEDIVERIGVRRTEEAMARADLILLVLSPQDWQDDTNRTTRTGPFAERIIEVINKCDLGIPYELRIAYPDALPVSAKTGEGMPVLREIVRERLLGSEPLESALVSRGRHEEALAEAESAVVEALRTLEQDLPSDFLSVHLLEAVDRLGAITGETVGADIVDRIFSEFCVGK